MNPDPTRTGPDHAPPTHPASTAVPDRPARGPAGPRPVPVPAPALGRPVDAPTGAPGSIDCATCVMQHTAACDDCVVTFICSREPDEAVVIDVDEARALRLLGDAGLVPHLRHRRRTG